MKVSVDDSSSLDKEAEVNNTLSRSCNKNPSLTTVVVSQVDEKLNIQDFKYILMVIRVWLVQLLSKI